MKTNLRSQELLFRSVLFFLSALLVLFIFRIGFFFSFHPFNIDYSFNDPQIKVPLVIHWPGKPKGTFDYLTTLIDLVPTILPDVLGCTNPISDYSVGQNIWEPDRKRNWFYSSGHDGNAFVEPDRIVLINKARMMEFLDKSYRPSKNRSIPPYMAEVMEETSRFAK